MVKTGSAVVKIYREKKGSGTYYRVGYYLSGKRTWLHCATLEDAKKEADAKAAQLSRGDVDAAQLTGRDRLVYGRALEALRPLNVPLDAAALEYADARKVLARHFSACRGRTLFHAAPWARHLSETRRRGCR